MKYQIHFLCKKYELFFDKNPNIRKKNNMEYNVVFFAKNNLFICIFILCWLFILLFVYDLAFLTAFLLLHGYKDRCFCIF
ncbi:hypothetical protein C7B19_24810 [Escherichia coli]|nr:hypothetical protein C7B19_24810 [Escherichia coli]